MAGEARRETCQDRVAERKRVREKRRARIERGAGDTPEEPGIKMMSRWRFDMRTHLTVTSQNQHEEKLQRDIQVNERGSEATKEEQTDEWKKMVRFEEEAPNTSASSDPYVALEHPAIGGDNKSAGVHTCAEVLSC